MNRPQNEQPRQLSKQEEEALLDEIAGLLVIPMLILAVISIALIVADLTLNLTTGQARVVSFIQTIIWAIFILEFALRLFLSEDRVEYLKKHWFDALVALFPALRVFQIAKTLAAIRLLQVARPTALVGTYFATRRTLDRLRKTFGQSSFPYVLATTAVVTLLGAVGMYALEYDASGSNITTYGDALWYVVGLVTTVGNELYPVTTEGRVLATMLMIYGVGVFSYLAGTLASYFVQANIQPTGQWGRQTEEGDRKPDSD